MRCFLGCFPPEILHAFPCVAEPAVVCHISLESLKQREAPPAANMNADQDTDTSYPSQTNIRTKCHSKSRRASEFVVKMRDLPQRSRPPD